MSKHDTQRKRDDKKEKINDEVLATSYKESHDPKNNNQTQITKNKSLYNNMMIQDFQKVDLTANTDTKYSKHKIPI